VQAVIVCVPCPPNVSTTNFCNIPAPIAVIATAAPGAGDLHRERLPAAEIDRCFDLDHQLRHVDTIFRRVFGAA